jgi:hypothetical protein
LKRVPPYHFCVSDHRGTLFRGALIGGGASIRGGAYNRGNTVVDIGHIKATSELGPASRALHSLSHHLNIPKSNSDEHPHTKGKSLPQRNSNLRRPLSSLPHLSLPAAARFLFLSLPPASGRLADSLFFILRLPAACGPFDPFTVASLLVTC